MTEAIRIGFDLQPLQSPFSANRGIGHYSRSLLRALLKKAHDENLRFEGLDMAPHINPGVEAHPALRKHVMPTGPRQVLLHRRVRDLVGPTLVGRYLASAAPALFHATSPMDAWDIFERDWFKQLPVVTTVYDLIPLIYKDHYLSDPKAEKAYRKRLRFIEQSDRLLAISDSVKSDLVRVAGIPANKIDVVYAGVSNEFRVQPLSDSEANRVRSKYGIRQPFVMCTGGADFRKNLPGLIESFAGLPSELRQSHQLVIVCHLDPTSEQELRRCGERCGVAGELVLTNYVPFSDLVGLYNLAKAFAFPSLYEGFGLPVVEAMACGVPVLTSSTSSLGEIAADAALTVRPENLGEMTAGLRRLLEDEQLRSVLRAKGLDRAKDFTWEKTADRTITAYRRALEEWSPQGPRGKGGLESSREKVAYVSPMPPDQSGIAQYSAELIPHLKQHMDLEIVVENVAEPGTQVDGCPVIDAETFAANYRKGLYSQVIYQMGNSTFHRYQYMLLPQYPGVVVMHERNLHDLVHAITLGEGHPEGYVQELEYCYGPAGRDEGVRIIRGEAVIRWEEPVNRRVLESATAVIAHSRYTAELLREDAPGVPVFELPLSVQGPDSPEDPDRLAAARKLAGVEPDVIVIAALGHLAHTKRIIPLVKAFGWLHKLFPQTRLSLVGKMDPYMEGEYREAVAASGAADAIRVTGYVSDEEFEHHLLATDIVVNLNYPVKGESSASLLRAFAAGKPVITSDIGPFAELDRKVCRHIPVNETETDCLFEALKELVEDKHLRRDLGRRGLEIYRTGHTPKMVAAAYAEMLNRLKGFPKAIRLDKALVQFAARALAEESRNISREETRALAAALHRLGDGAA